MCMTESILGKHPRQKIDFQIYPRRQSCSCPVSYLIPISFIFPYKVKKVKWCCNYIISDGRGGSCTACNTPEVRLHCNLFGFWTVDLFCYFPWKNFHLGSQYRVAYMQQNFGSYRVRLQAALLLKEHCASATFQQSNSSKYIQFFISLFSSIQVGWEGVFMTD